MNTFQRTNIPSQINGKEIVKVVNGKKVGSKGIIQGMIDRNDAYYVDNQAEYHIGLISSWGSNSRETYPMLAKLLEKGSEIKVKGLNGSFTFDKHFYDEQKGMRVVSSTVDDAGVAAGVDENEFDIILSEKCYPGDILGTDPYGDEEQLYVVGCEASEYGVQGWRVTVKLTNSSPGAVYNPALLDVGIPYFKINHVVTEYTTSFTGVDNIEGAPSGFLTARFRLGGVRGVEGFVTGFADAQGSGFAAAKVDSNVEKSVSQMQKKYGDGDIGGNTVIFGNKPNDVEMESFLKTARATSLMEYLVEKTLNKRTLVSHIWQKGGRIKSNESGATVTLNEGIWHSIQKGKVINIPKMGGITKSHIAEAVNYTFKNNPDLPWEEREVVFEVGKLAENNLLKLFQEEIQQQITVLKQSGVLASLFGNQGMLDSKLRDSFVSGTDLNNLEIKSLIRFTKVTLIGIAGKVSFKHNPALDHLGGQTQEFKGQFQDNYDWTAHSAIIWDVTDNQYSNNDLNLRGADVVNGDSQLKDNLYIVRPEDGMLFKGSENGRWDKGSTSGIVSSSKVIGSNFWAFNSSATFIPRPENVVIIQLAKGARKSGMVPVNY